jgi:hypothetical protein
MHFAREYAKNSVFLQNYFASGRGIFTAPLQFAPNCAIMMKKAEETSPRVLLGKRVYVPRADPKEAGLIP